MKKNLLIILFVLLCLPIFVHASTDNGTIDSTYKYAWSEKGGWINFGCDNCNVKVTDGGLAGYAWSENYGWVNLAPSQSGVQNNGEGVLSGSAWGEKSGWINFAGVTINSQGQFKGTSNNETLGVLSFDCDNCAVKTDWRPKSLRVVNTPVASTSGGGAVALVLNPPVEGFGVSINEGVAVTNSQAVTVYLDGGTTATQVELSNTPNFTGVTEAYEQAKNWVLTPGDGKKTVYVKFYGANGSVSQVLQANIALDTQNPDVKVDKTKFEFDYGQDAIISGTVDKSSQIFLNWDSQIGLVNSESGKWSVNLGKLSSGNHSVVIKAEDSVGNSKIINTVVFVKEKTATQTSGSVFKKIDDLGKSLSNLFKAPLSAPKEIIKIPKEAPPVMSGEISLTSPAENFALTPLPQDLQSLAVKFPQLAQTFKDVGITKFNDVSSLKNANLTLPSLGEVVQPHPAEVIPGKFMSSPGIPLSNFTLTEKQKIPTNVVFARTDNGLVDLKASLSVDEQGQVQQKINILSGAPLDLIIKPDNPAKSVTAYLIFNSRKSSVSSLDLKNATMASLTTPIFTQTNGAVPEQKLVLSQFDFKDQGDGVFAAKMQAPVASGQYQIITVIKYKDIALGDKQVSLVSVVDPEGYIYERNGSMETRINGAVVSLYWLNPNTKLYEVWPADKFQQENPQVTDSAGTYSFLVPSGYYYISVSAPGFSKYQSSSFQVSDGSGIHMNVELGAKAWWSFVYDWKNILLIAVILLLIYNFYRDRAREGVLGGKNKQLAKA